MDDLYPGMNIEFTSAGEIYIYGSIILGIIGAITLSCYGEHGRVYRTIKRKNTDENPIIQI